MKAKKQQYKQGEKIGTVEKVKSKHEEIAQKIIDALESNNIPWKKPWTSCAPKNLKTGKEYRGINHFLLSLIPSQYPVFATFNQIKEAGGSVKKGSKSLPVYFYKPWTKEDEVNGETVERRFFIMRQYQVFTMEQVEGIELSNFVDPVLDFQPIMKPENLMNAYLQAEMIKLLEAQGAGYSILDDYIVMPKRSSFLKEDYFYSTVFHEMIHSTRHEKRTARDTKPNKFGSKEYAFEELVAEFGAAMLASYCGVDTSLEEGQHTTYIKGWLKVIKDDPTIVYKAASKAQQAVDYVLKVSGFEVFGETENEEKKGA